MNNQDYKLFIKCLKEHKLLRIPNGPKLDINFCELFNHRLKIEWMKIDKLEKIEGLYKKNIGLHVNCNKAECEKYHTEFQTIQNSYIDIKYNQDNSIKKSINKLSQFRLKNWHWTILSVETNKK